MTKIVAVNAGPRKGWNTDTLIDEAIRGAEREGAEVKKYDLYKLDKYTGCISCFICKKEQFKGQCIVNDGLKQVLADINEADALIIGSPNYLSDLTAAYRALYERLIFPNVTYNPEIKGNDNNKKVLLIMTSNAPENFYTQLLENYQTTLNNIVGPTEIFISDQTQQIEDYSKTDWPWFFDAEERYERHEKIFPKHKEEVYQKGRELAK